MRHPPSPADRRGFLRIAAAFAGGAIVSGCGGGGGDSAGATIGAAADAITAPLVAPAPVLTAGHRLNLALNLGYLGAQFYGAAATGSGLSDAALGGVGTPGQAIGARQVAFADATIARHAADLAADKAGHVAALRTLLGSAAAAQPTIDLSAAPTGAFSAAARRAGMVSAGVAFDPYADDASFLIGAFFIEDRVAAAYRTLLDQASDDASATLIAGQLADAIYHGGLVRTLLADRAAADAAVDTTVTRAGALLAALDGSNVGDQSLAGARGASSDVADAEGRPIPFTRDAGQVLRTLYLSATDIGGFLPAGANGVSA